ncbi:MAG: AraC family transcriptional regulator [Methylophilaceae bacterium]
MDDRLSAFFNQHGLSAHMFFTGTLCKNIDFEDNLIGGFLHLIRRGTVIAHSVKHAPLIISEPSLLLYPRPAKHRFEFNGDGEADLTCATIDLGDGYNNILAEALPAVLLMPLNNLPQLASTLELLFNEAEQAHSGRQASIDRLFEYLLIQLLRHILDNNQTNVGLIAGLADKRLAKALTAMHNEPSLNWSLEALADKAGMSRARFAVHFREVVGTTPIDHLTKWRIGLAQTLLKKGKPIGIVANEVGYSGAVVFSRIFKAKIGLTPKTWLQLARAS